MKGRTSACCSEATASGAGHPLGGMGDALHIRHVSSYSEMQSDGCKRTEISVPCIQVWLG